MRPLVLRLAAHFGVGAMLIDGSTEIALWGVVITSIAGIVAQYLKNKDDAAREERRHKFDLEDREAASNGRAAVFQGLEQNAALTREAGAKADMAYVAANDVNAKIARLAATALAQDRATEKASTEAVRADIAALAKATGEKPAE